MQAIAEDLQLVEILLFLINEKNYNLENRSTTSRNFIIFNQIAMP